MSSHLCGAPCPDVPLVWWLLHWSGHCFEKRNVAKLRNCKPLSYVFLFCVCQVWKPLLKILTVRAFIECGGIDCSGRSADAVEQVTFWSPWSQKYGPCECGIACILTCSGFWANYCHVTVIFEPNIFSNVSVPFSGSIQFGPPNGGKNSCWKLDFRNTQRLQPLPQAITKLLFELFIVFIVYFCWWAKPMDALISAVIDMVEKIRFWKSNNINNAVVYWTFWMFWFDKQRA